MKAHFRTANNRITFEVEAPNALGLMEGIAELQEIFEAEQCCKACGSVNIQFRVRHVEEYVFPELRCVDCQAQFSFGQRKGKENAGKLFPKRDIGKGGWYHYQGGQREED